MRSFLNTVLQFIGAATLTDAEFVFAQTQIQTAAWDQATYACLSQILAERELVSSLQVRLQKAFEARGVEVVQVVADGRSNIYLGDVL